MVLEQSKRPASKQAFIEQGVVAFNRGIGVRKLVEPLRGGRVSMIHFSRALIGMMVAIASAPIFIFHTERPSYFYDVLLL